jgi:penicillin amidase
MLKPMTVLLLCLAAMLPGCRTLIEKGYPLVEGEASGLPLRAPVEVLRDTWGIPHLYARSATDLMTGLGYVHAQDRLWQMESLRRLAQGRLSEVAGRSTIPLDYFARLIGLPQMRRQAIRGCSTEELGLLEAYSAGVNAFLASRARDLPLEFRSLKLTPEPWTPEDCASFLVVVSWQMQLNFAQELIAFTQGRSLTLDEWNLLFPSHFGARLPDEPQFAELKKLRIGALHPAALAFHAELPDRYGPKSLSKNLRLAAAFGGGSNSWAVAEGRDGKPLLANDPHLGLSLPGIWYFCHLNVAGENDGLNVAGATIAGAPSIGIGHNENVAWGLTNVMLDYADLLVLPVDPQHPTRYRTGGRELEMSREELVIGLPHGKSATLPLFRTVHGPVITALEPGIEAAVVLKWHGTLPEGELQDYSLRSLFAIMRSRNVAEALGAGEGLKWLAMNLTAADNEGHIGWHATGAAPLRRGYSGRLPALDPGSAGGPDWEGFLPYDALPHRLDPRDGRVVTANHRSVTDDDPHPLTFAWATPYRYERINELLNDTAAPGPEQFARLQMDVHSNQAERILPRLFAFGFRDPRAVRAVGLLKSWDREVRGDSAGAAVFEVFLTEWTRELLEDELGDDLALYEIIKMLAVEDVILDRPDSTLWDRKDTPQRETPQEILERSLVRTVRFLERRLGRNPDAWSWQKLHRYVFRHPGASPLTARLLNRGPFPASGDRSTINLGGYLPSRDNYDVNWIPSLRLIVPLGEPDAARIIGPLGQSGQPGHPHYDDLVGPWIRGESVPLPLSRQAVERAAAARLWLRP